MKLKQLCAGWALSAIVGGFVLVDDVQAQRRRSYDPAEFLKRMDNNGNGMIDPDEMSDRSRGFLSRAAERAGLSMDQPLPVDKLTEAFNAMREGGGDSNSSGSSSGNSSSSESRDRDRDDDDDRDRDRRRDDDRDRDRSRSDSSRAPAPRTPGFGTTDSTKPAPGFNVPLDQNDALIEKRFERKVIDYVDRMLSEQDTNKDGYIDSVEWKAGRWSTPPESSDTNNDKRLSKMELCVRISKRFGGDREAPKTESGGEAKKDDRSSSGQGSGDAEAAKYRGYAESLIKQNDQDKSGMLEKSKGEWDKLKSDHRDSDTNKDGVITIDELIVKLQSYSKDSPGGSSGSSASRSGGGSSRSSWWKKDQTAKEEPKKSYRFLSPTERLPKGLPDWFIRNDRDADGQIMMSEFAAAWTEALATEFMSYDLDGDGVITPAEALASGKK
jgi:hypothetical protein